MDWEGIFWVGVLILVLVIASLPFVDSWLNEGALVDCRVAGYDYGYKRGVAFGDTLCHNVVQEEVREYFILE